MASTAPLAVLAALSLILAAGVAGSLVCPTGTQASSVSLDTSNLKASFYLGVFMIEQTSSASECLERAMAAECEGVDAKFFIYSLLGFNDPHNSIQGNCAFGSACIDLQQGDVPAIVGRVPLAECITEGATAVATENPSSPAIVCPTGLARQQLRIRDSSFHSLTEQGLVTIVEATDAQSCTRKAREATCSGIPSGFFIYSPKGFWDPSERYMGSCALFPACFGLQEGDVPVTAGNVGIVENCPKPRTQGQVQVGEIPAGLALRGIVRE